MPVFCICCFLHQPSVISICMPSMDTCMLSRWKNLPKDVIFSITKRLNSRLDTLRMRAVCRTFRAMIPLPPKTIIANPNIKIPFPECSYAKIGHFVLTEATVYAIQPLRKITNAYNSTRTWFLKLQQSVFNTNTVRVKDPLSKYVIDTLASRLPESLNTLDYRVKEVTKAYALELFALDEGETRHYEFKEGMCLLFEKVVVSTRPGTDGFQQFSLMALFGGCSLGVWRSEVKQWDYIRSGVTTFVDVIYHKEKFYALSKEGEILSVDCKSLKVTKHANLMMSLTNGTRRLLKSSDDLFLVEKLFIDVYNRNGFSGVEECGYPFRCNVRKLDEKKGAWVRVKHLGSEDRVFFLGDDCSFSVSAKEFPGCKPNCIYFVDNMFDKKHGKQNRQPEDDYPGADTGIYDFEDNIAGPLWSFSFHSNIFWPPPKWLTQTASS